MSDRLSFPSTKNGPSVSSGFTTHAGAAPPPAAAPVVVGPGVVGTTVVGAPVVGDWVVGGVARRAAPGQQDGAGRPEQDQRLPPAEHAPDGQIVVVVVVVVGVGSWLAPIWFGTAGVPGRECAERECA